jgi:hypothetical protein
MTYMNRSGVFVGPYGKPLKVEVVTILVQIYLSGSLFLWIGL